MRPYALALGSVLSVSPLLASCSPERDYAVAVSWTINGMVPDPGICAEQGIARGRFEVSTASGKPLKTLEANCDSTTILSDNNEYGGFLTTRAFEWDRDYNYSLGFVDAAGAAISTPGQGTFYLAFDSADIYELNVLDYLNPQGTVGALSAEWSVGSNPDLVAACTAGRISKVRILVASALDTKLEDTVQLAEANCSDGRFVSNGKLLATGDYLFQYVAISDIGNVAQAGQPIAAQVDRSDVALPRQMFLSN